MAACADENHDHDFPTLSQALSVPRAATVPEDHFRVQTSEATATRCGMLVVFFILKRTSHCRVKRYYNAHGKRDMDLPLFSS